MAQWDPLDANRTFICAVESYRETGAIAALYEALFQFQKTNSAVTAEFFWRKLESLDIFLSHEERTELLRLEDEHSVR